MRLPIVSVLLLLIPLCFGQEKLTKYTEQRDALRQRGAAALAQEDAAEKAAACNVPMNTADTGRCLRQVNAVTQTNYGTYAASIRALLRLQPSDASQPERDDAIAIARRFRAAESLWLRYRETQCDAVETMSCEQDLTRRHMQELSGLYARLFQ